MFRGSFQGSLGVPLKGTRRRLDSDKGGLEGFQKKASLKGSFKEKGTIG